MQIQVTFDREEIEAILLRECAKMVPLAFHLKDTSNMPYTDITLTLTDEKQPDPIKP